MKIINLLRLLSPAMLLVWLLGSRAAHADAESWPEIPLPPKSSAQWVGDSMRVNGVPMRLMQFQSNVSAAEIVEYYRAYWTGGYPTKPSVQAAGDATLVGQAHGPYFMTVKVKPAAHGASEGLIGVSRMVGSKVEHSPGQLPLMPGAVVTQVVESNDPGKRSRQMLIASPSSVTSCAHYYEAALAREGWHEVQLNEAPRESNRPAGTFLAFAREGSEVQLSVVGGANGRGSAISATLVTKDTVPQAF